LIYNAKSVGHLYSNAMYPILLKIGEHHLTSWVFFALVGSWIAYFIVKLGLLRLGMRQGEISAFFLTALAIWFVGANIGQRLTVDFSSYGIAGIFRPIGFSGYMLYGGVILCALYASAFWWISGWHRRIPLLHFWDLGSYALMWAFAFGRLGCTFYGCCYGKPSGAWPGYKLNYERWDHNASLFPQTLKDVSLHPATLYEALGLFAIALTVMILRKRQSPERLLKPGRITWLCWMLYAALRFAVEFIRYDDRGAPSLGLYPSQWIAALTIATGIVIAISLRNKKPVA
jgi:phosphatidylglycerol:prolipoprotein diacylglycerol transferase